MSIEAILNAIHAVGDTQVSEIDSHASAEAEEILHKARDDAARLGEEARLAALAPAAREGLRIARGAQFDASQRVVDTQNALIDTVIQRTRERLAEMRSDETYPPLLRQLTKEAVTDLKQALTESEKFWLEADPRDQAILDRMLTELAFDLPVRYTLTSWGGLIASSEDGRVVVLNTLEARLERAMPSLRRHLTALLKESISTQADPARQMASSGV